MNQIKKLHQIIRFGISGVAGFLVDAGIVTLGTQELRIGPILAQVIAFSLAVTTTWLINRHWTFAEHASANWLHELTRYVAANSIGAAVNNSVYFLLVFTVDIFLQNPVLAVASGSVAGMIFNFISSKFFVFNPRKTTPQRTSI